MLLRSVWFLCVCHRSPSASDGVSPAVNPLMTSSLSSVCLAEFKAEKGPREQGRTIHTNQWIQMRNETLSPFSPPFLSLFLSLDFQTAALSVTTQCLAVWLLWRWWLNSDIFMINNRRLSGNIELLLTQVYQACLLFRSLILKGLFCPVCTLFQSWGKQRVLIWR